MNVGHFQDFLLCLGNGLCNETGLTPNQTNEQWPINNWRFLTEAEDREVHKEADYLFIYMKLYKLLLQQE